MMTPRDNSKDVVTNCHSCGFKTMSLRAYRASELGSRKHNTHMWLCLLCASTLTGNAYEYPDQYDNADVLKTICFVGNTILEEIRGVSPSDAKSH
jgi:ribosomal protein L37AE/L43A